MHIERHSVLRLEQGNITSVDPGQGTQPPLPCASSFHRKRICCRKRLVIYHGVVFKIFPTGPLNYSIIHIHNLKQKTSLHQNTRIHCLILYFHPSSHACIHQSIHLAAVHILEGTWLLDIPCSSII